MRPDARHREQQVHLGDDVLADIGGAADAGQLRAFTLERHFEADAIAGHHLPPELRFVDAAQVRDRARRLLLAVEQQDRRGLRQRLDHQDAGHQRLAREVALEELFVDGGVLDRDDPLTADVLGDGVDEVEGVPVAEPVEENWNVGRHVIRWGSVQDRSPGLQSGRAPIWRRSERKPRGLEFRRRVPC